MSVIIGEIETFPETHADKAQVLKILEESAEVFSAYESYAGAVIVEGRESVASCASRTALVSECADVIQAVSNLLDALGVHDMTNAMERCRQRNHDRGRM